VDPLRPAEDSVALALAGAAQLVGTRRRGAGQAAHLGELVDALVESTVVGEALTGSFKVPAPLLSRDEATVPGTEVTVEVARDPHQLVAWARYMGNCIAGWDYVQEAKAGRTVLLALRGRNGNIVANVELIARRKDWQLGDLAARFNAEPSDDLRKQVTAWVAALPPRQPARSALEPRPHPHGTVHRPYRRVRAVMELRDALVPLAQQATEDVPVDVLSRAATGAPSGLAGIVALARSRRYGVDAALREFLATDGLAPLWTATASRPLAAAVAALDPALRERHGRVDLLFEDAPLPATPRRLARTAGIIEARAVEVVARRLRAALGRLVLAGDPALARWCRATPTPGCCARSCCWSRLNAGPRPRRPSRAAENSPYQASRRPHWTIWTVRGGGPPPTPPSWAPTSDGTGRWR
jgi:hypothetical protein